MSKINSYLRNQASPRKLLITGMLVLMVVTAWFTLTAATQRKITVLDGGAAVIYKTNKNTVGEVIADANITLNPYDVVSVSLDTPVEEAKVVEIKRAREVKIKDGNNEAYTVLSGYDTAEEILSQYNVWLSEHDEIALEGDTVTITRIILDQQIVNEPILFETVYEDDPTMFVGNQKVAVYGVNGCEDVVYYDTYINGEFIKRDRTSSLVIAQPINQVVKVGTKDYAAAPESYKKVITCKATAYDGSYATLGYHNPRTALGAVPTVGTVAVDPRVIPLGTKLYIASTDGSYIYGYCFAGDTGGAIKGNRVDLFMGSRSEALSFGARQVNVFILE